MNGYGKINKEPFLHHIDWPFGQLGTKSNEFGRIALYLLIKVLTYTLFVLIFARIYFRAPLIFIVFARIYFHAPLP